MTVPKKTKTVRQPLHHLKSYTPIMRSYFVLDVQAFCDYKASTILVNMILSSKVCPTGRGLHGYRLVLGCFNWSIQYSWLFICI